MKPVDLGCADLPGNSTTDDTGLVFYYLVDCECGCKNEAECHGNESQEDS